MYIAPQILRRLTLAAPILAFSLVAANFVSAVDGSHQVSASLAGLDYVREVAPGISQIDTQEELSQAIVTGFESADYLNNEIFKAEILAEHFDYELQVLPLLKEQAVLALVSYYADGEHELVEVGLGPIPDGNTEIERMITDLMVVNPELAVYVQTASYVISSMQISVAAGEPFDVEDARQHLSVRAESELELLNPLKLSPEELFAEDVFASEVFMDGYTDLYSTAVANYLRVHQGQYNRQASLLGSLADEQLAPVVIESVEFVLKKLMLEGDGIARLSALSEGSFRDAFGRIAEISPEVATRLSQLYLMFALDALEQDEVAIARDFLGYSLDTKEGLPLQEKLGRLLEGTTLKAENSEAEGDSQAPSLGFYLLLIIGMLSFLVFRRIKSRP